MLTQEYLKNRLHYDLETGIFTWKLLTTKNQVKEGGVAGFKSARGYLSLELNTKTYLLHRLAWLYVYGNWPVGDIDHIDGNPLNNTIKNLRDVSTRDNCNNRKSHRIGQLVGTTYVKQNNNWKSRIQVNGKTIQIGTFNTQKEAHEAYLLKRMELGI